MSRRPSFCNLCLAARVSRVRHNTSSIRKNNEHNDNHVMTIVVDYPLSVFCLAKLAVEMANPIQALNENFFYNSMLARALVQLMPISERQTIRAWLEQLHRMDANSEEMTLRNDYMWFLLLMLQNKKLSTPFDRMPPRELRPIRDIVSENVYEEVVNAADQGASWIDQMTSKEDGDAAPSKPETISSPPAHFFSNQPIPKNGIICYLAAFSDHDY